MGPFGEASFGVGRMTSISGRFYEQGDCTSLVVIYRIAFVCSKDPQAQGYSSISTVSCSFYTSNLVAAAPTELA